MCATFKIDIAYKCFHLLQGLHNQTEQLKYGILSMSIIYMTIYVLYTDTPHTHMPHSLFYSIIFILSFILMKIKWKYNM